MSSLNWQCVFDGWRAFSSKMVNGYPMTYEVLYVKATQQWRLTGDREVVPRDELFDSRNEAQARAENLEAAAVKAVNE